MGNTKTIVMEEMHPEKEWFEAARHQTKETLASFVDQVMNYYAHDYGTVCHAISACALAAAERQTIAQRDVVQECDTTREATWRINRQMYGGGRTWN